jgi:hypothetical protein
LPLNAGLIKKVEICKSPGVGDEVKLAVKPAGAEPPSGVLFRNGVALPTTHCAESKLYMAVWAWATTALKSSARKQLER